MTARLAFYKIPEVTTPTITGVTELTDITGTFEVTDMDTFDTTQDQSEGNNWKPSEGFDNMASFVTVEPKCTLIGYQGTNFRKQMGQFKG